MSRTLLLGAALAGALAWLAAAGLAPPARAFVVVLAAVVPALAIGQLPLMERAVGELSRVALYASSAASIWLLWLGAMAAGLLGGFSAAELGLVRLPAGELAVWSAAGTAGGLAVLALGRALGVRESPILRYLLPRSRIERLAFVGLSLSAGGGEEMAYRAFLVPALTVVTGSVAAAAAIGAALFGLVHAYQRPAGIARAALLGLVLTVPLLVTGSVLPSMIAHAAIDLLGGLWLGDWLLRRGDGTE